MLKVVNNTTRYNRGLTCYDVRQVAVVFSERGLGIGWCGGEVYGWLGFQQGFKDFIWGYGVFVI